MRTLRLAVAVTQTEMKILTVGCLAVRMELGARSRNDGIVFRAASGLKEDKSAFRLSPV